MATETRPPSAVFEAPATIHRMLFAVWALLANFSPEQRTRALMPMDDPRRLDWDFIPKPDRTGIPMFEMSRHQRVLAQSLLQAGLSVKGYSQALSIMAMENVLRERDVISRGFGVLAGDFRDPEAYYFSIFGRPGFNDTWGWRVLGHHLSLSYTIIDQRYLSVTPCNMGGQPVVAGVLHPLAEDEDRAFELLHSMDADQLRAVVIHPVAPADYVTRQVPRIGAVELPDYEDLGIPGYRITDEDREALKLVRKSPSGISGRDLSESQATQLRDLVYSYLDKMPEEVASAHRGRFDTTGLQDVYVAWAGGLKPGESHYYRVHSPDLLIEFDNAIDSGNHIHSIWRDLANDLGHDLLLDHYERERVSGHHLTTRLVSSEPE